MAFVENNLSRKLTAILLENVVGYSRLMEHDEADSLARLNAHRKALIDPTISAHHGRIMKQMGDGVLVEFSSVVEVVLCT